MSQPELPPDPALTEIEAALESLSPSPGRLDRDRLMYLAGRASARPPLSARWGWPAIAAGLAVVAIGEAALLAHRPEPRVVERLVVVRGPAPEPAEPPPPSEPAKPPSPPAWLASGPGELAPVVILHRSGRADSSSNAPVPSWPGGSTDAPLRVRVQRFGLDALPEPPPLPLAMRPASPLPDASARSLRSEIERLLYPGESS